MKKSHKLENGTLLEVGKKYNHKIWEKTYWHKVLSLGEKLVFTVDSDGNESAEPYPKELIPYTEPKEKDLEGLEAYVLIKGMYKGREAKIKYLDEGRLKEYKQNYCATTMEIITLEEAKQRGLNLKALGL